MKKNIYMFFFSILSTGCFYGNIEKQIGDEIEKKCTNNACTIDINQLTSFTWDKMYVFGSELSGMDIDKIMGIDYPYYSEFTRPIIFIKDNKIVHFENNYEDEENPTDGRVIFDYPDTVHYQVYFSGKAIFKARTKKFDEGRYFILSQPGPR